MNAPCIKVLHQACRLLFLNCPSIDEVALNKSFYLVYYFAYLVSVVFPKQTVKKFNQERLVK